MTRLLTAAETPADCTPPLGHPRSDMEEGRVNGVGLAPRRGSSDWGPITLLDKTKEFFQTCDVEGNGFITRTDMRVRYRACVCVCVFCCILSILLEK